MEPTAGKAALANSFPFFFVKVFFTSLVAFAYATIVSLSFGGAYGKALVWVLGQEDADCFLRLGWDEVQALQIRDLRQ